MEAYGTISVNDDVKRYCLGSQIRRSVRLDGTGEVL